MAAKVSIVIATSGRRTDLLRRTLESLALCELPDSYHGAIVVENGARNGTEPIVQEYAMRLRAAYRFCEPANKSHALNVAVDEIGEGLIIFLDDDVRMLPDLLVRYTRAADGIEDGMFFGGPVEVDYEVPPPGWLRSYLPPSARGWRLERDVEVDWPAFLGFNWAAFAGDLKRLGGFETSRGPGSGVVSVGDETSMQEHLLAAGLRGRYVPGATVWHYVPADRCSPEWALERKYAQSMSQAINRARNGELRSYGYYLMKRMIVSPVRLALAAASLDERRWFAARYWSSHRRGTLHGLQLSRRQAHPHA